jgi:peroxiredoxin
MQFNAKLGRVIHLDGLLLLILVGSLGINVCLGVAGNRRVPSTPSRPELLAAGSKAPAFEGRDLKGAHVSLTYNGNKAGTLLYVFSPSCHWCERNRANIDAIAKARPDLRIVGVALSGDSQQLAAPNPFHLTVRPTPETIRAYGLGGTPATIFVSPDGRVVSAWSGAYGGPIATDVSKVLAVTLPGLLQE